MQSESDSGLDRLRQPAYTGENRCLPCTAVNLAIAVVGTGLAAVLSPYLAAAVLGLSLAAIYLRGYVVPGTPALTRRFFPDRVLRAFGKDPTDDVAWDPDDLEVFDQIEDERENRVRPDEFLLETGVVAPAEDGDRRRLAEDFAAAVETRLAAHREGTVTAETLADVFDAEPTDVAALDRDYPAYEVGIHVRKWPSETALVADVAAHQAFDAWTDRWREVPLAQRVDILRSLRSLRADCPACGGPLRQSAETLDSCCHSAELVMLTCADCGERLLEADPETVELPHPTGI